ncbi:hypothetical protein GW915_09795 [bacterium]|nr:hypothetical protein [bacterium]
MKGGCAGLPEQMQVKNFLTMRVILNSVHVSGVFMLLCLAVPSLQAFQSELPMAYRPIDTQAEQCLKAGNCFETTKFVGNMQDLGEESRRGGILSGRIDRTLIDIARDQDLLSDLVSVFQRDSTPKLLGSLGDQDSVESLILDLKEMALNSTGDSQEVVKMKIESIAKSHFGRSLQQDEMVVIFDIVDELATQPDHWGDGEITRVARRLAEPDVKDLARVEVAFNTVVGPDRDPASLNNSSPVLDSLNAVKNIKGPSFVDGGFSAFSSNSFQLANQGASEINDEAVEAVSELSQKESVEDELASKSEGEDEMKKPERSSLSDPFSKFTASNDDVKDTPQSSEEQSSQEKVAPVEEDKDVAEAESVEEAPVEEKKKEEEVAKVPDVKELGLDKLTAKRPKGDLPEVVPTKKELTPEDVNLRENFSSYLNQPINTTGELSAPSELPLVARKSNRNSHEVSVASQGQDAIKNAFNNIVKEKSGHDLSSVIGNESLSSFLYSGSSYSNLSDYSSDESSSRSKKRPSSRRPASSSKANNTVDASGRSENADLSRDEAVEQLRQTIEGESCDEKQLSGIELQEARKIAQYIETQIHVGKDQDFSDDDCAAVTATLSNLHRSFFSDEFSFEHQNDRSYRIIKFNEACAIGMSALKPALSEFKIQSCMRRSARKWMAGGYLAKAFGAPDLLALKAGRVCKTATKSVSSWTAVKNKEELWGNLEEAAGVAAVAIEMDTRYRYQACHILAGIDHVQKVALDSIAERKNQNVVDTSERLELETHLLVDYMANVPAHSPKSGADTRTLAREIVPASPLLDVSESNRSKRVAGMVSIMNSLGNLVHDCASYMKPTTEVSLKAVASDHPSLGLPERAQCLDVQGIYESYVDRCEALAKNDSTLSCPKVPGFMTHLSEDANGVHVEAVKN